jgi:methylmalonyl-CoA carboxyltransferase large subunit
MVKTDKIIESLQQQIVALEGRLALLEAKAKPAPAPTPAPQPVVQDQVSEETMLIIAAAVAAYLGERAHIRVVRLVPTHAWAQQGRVSIQASHQLT